MALKFLDKFKKEVAKLDSVGVGIRSTEEWLSSGSYALNRALSGNFFHAYPMGKISMLAGPSGCLPAEEAVQVYVFRTDVKPDIKIKTED